MACLHGFLRRSAAVLLAALALGGCRASYVDRGAALYADRKYVDADELFEHNESRFVNASHAERARYALYRGATLLSLGDSARSQYWLSVAASESRKEPGALSDEEQATLRGALTTSGQFARQVAKDERPQSTSASLVSVTTAE